MKETKCPKCGKPIKQDVTKCENCGLDLKEKSASTTATFISMSNEASNEIEVSPIEDHEEVVLVIKKGPIVGQRMHLNQGDTYIGRDPKSDIFLNDITVSRRHAKISYDGSKVTIKDIGSLNGTYVNNEQKEAGALNNGDELQIGKFVLVFLSKPR